MPINNDEEMKRIAQMVRDGRVPEAQVPLVMQELRDYDQRRSKAMVAKQQEQDLMAQHDPDKPWYKHDNPDAKQVGELSAMDWAEGVYETAMMGLTGAVAQPVSGVGGLVAGGVSKLFGSDQALENAAKTQEFLANLLTNDPEGEAMKTFGAMVGETAESVARRIDDGIYDAAGGNAEIATALKTTLYGVPSIVGLGRMKIPARIKHDIGVKDTMKRVVKETEEAGYSLDGDVLPFRVKDKAHELVPDTSYGAGWDEILDDVRKAEKVSREAIDDAYDAARATQAFVEIKPLRLMAKDLKKNFESKYNVKAMPQLGDHLTDLRRLASTISNTGRKAKKRRTEVDLNELELLRQRITNDISGTPGMRNYTPQDRALLALRSELDDKIDELFRRGAMSGDPNAVKLWQDARGLARGHAQRFNADNNIRKMLLEDTTAEGAYRMVIGASAMGAKPQAVATIRRMKEILGESHPSLVNIRKAMIRDVVLPALDNDKANFGLLGKNIDKLLRQNPALVAEVGIDVPELVKLRRAAHVANEAVRLAPEKFGAEYANSVLASVVFGHGIARKGALVRTAKKILNRTMGVGLLSAKDIRRHLLEAEYDVPIRSHSGPELAMWLAMTSSAAASDAGADSYEEEEQQ